jgi:hypothetical protein
MHLIQRPFRGPLDFAAIMALAVQTPVEQLSATALPYQLSSWALDTAENVGLWEDGTARLVGFALARSARSSRWASTPNFNVWGWGGPRC